MKIIEETLTIKGKSGITLKKLVADSGKKIRDINDIYVKEYVDENTGEIVPEHNPYYTDIIYLGKQFDEKDLDKLYVEEDEKNIK